MTDFSARKPLYQKIGEMRGSKVLCYVTGDRQGMEAQIHRDSVDFFVDHLDAAWPCSKISLILHTNGGDTAAAWQIVNLLRSFSDDLEILIPSKALSSGTLISLGANRIVMTKQASLGPIDPSLNSPLGPQIPAQFGGQTWPVSVEAIQGYIDVVTDQLKVGDPSALASIWISLSEKIHPLVLGQIYRTRSQIRLLANRLLEHQEVDKEMTDNIISFLCSESGSHDHTINRRAARKMGLKVEQASHELYEVLQAVHNSYSAELKLREPYRPDLMLAKQHAVAGQATMNYSVPRLLLESLDFGSSRFISEGFLQRDAHGQVVDVRTFEGWR